MKLATASADTDTSVLSARKPATQPLNAPPSVANERPRVFRGLLWSQDDKEEITSPSARASETAPPLPRPPVDSSPKYMAAEQTIRDHPELFAIVTPIKADRLEELLVTHPNRPLVESVVVGFREGFWPFAGIEPEGYPSVWEEANHRLTPEQEDFLGKQIAEEESVGRYSAPFGPDLLPGMYSMPLGAVPKTDSGDFRTINDQSAGDFSLNSLVNPDDTHIRLDTVKDLCHNLVVHRRTHSHIPLWLFKSDVSKAYRRLPLAFHWQIKQVVSFRGRRWIDRCVCFGGRGSPKTWCASAKHVPAMAFYGALCSAHSAIVAVAT